MLTFIADTYLSSLAKLTGDEQKATKQTSFDLQLDPSGNGLQFHRIDKSKDKNFWSVRVNLDLRVIVHKTADRLILCYVDHHKPAYDWAERRKIETHPKTNVAQLVEIRETVREVVVPAYVQATPDESPLFARHSDDVLLGYGVPAEWLNDVRSVKNEEELLAVAGHLPQEASDALLELAIGGKPRVAKPDETKNPFEHPDAQRRFRLVGNQEELAQALEYPWDKWIVFLHPEQREWVKKDQYGPARVSGSAGTGKTIVAIHRAAHLARANPDSRVLLTTFTVALANSLETLLKKLLASEPRLAERIDVYSLAAIGLRLYQMHVGPTTLASREAVRKLVREAASAGGDHKVTTAFLISEWEHVVDAWQLDTWEEYRDVARLGRRTRLPESSRRQLWTIFEHVRGALATNNLITESALFTKLANVYGSGRTKPPFDFAVVDEAQDLGVAQLKFLAALAAGRPDALFFTGDLGQRIFQQPFSWKSLGVDVRGRSRTLRVNYRTSHQIRTQADRLLGPSVSDADGETESREDTISVFNGPPPVLQTFASPEEEIEGVAAWLSCKLAAQVALHEIGVFVRSDAELPRAKAAVERAGGESGLGWTILDESSSAVEGRVSISTMHLAKGLEFRAVAVMACDDQVVPLLERITSVGDDGDLREIYDAERHLLYVACTRARDALIVTGVEPASEFLVDLGDH